MLEFNAGRRLVHFLVEVRNVPGALEKPTAILARNGVNILSGFHHAATESERGFWSFFADLTESKVEPVALAQELKSLPATLDVQFEVGHNGLLIDAFHFPVRWGGERAIMVRAKVMKSFIDRVNEMFRGGSTGAMILYEMGVVAGRGMFDALKTEIGLDVLKTEFQWVFSNLARAGGWGIFSISNLDYEKKTATIRVMDSFECTDSGERSSPPRSRFIRGNIAGWFSELFQRRVNVIEQFCLGKGDPLCEFTIEPAPT